MIAAVQKVPGRHHEPYLDALASGLIRHGVTVRHFDDLPPPGADFYAVWGWRKAKRVLGHFPDANILVAEHGYIGNRREWTSLGWNGLNGRATFAPVSSSDRFMREFHHLMKPWKGRLGGTALLIGQVHGDMSIAHVDMANWYDRTAKSLVRDGWDVVFRPHPVSIERGDPCPAANGARLSVNVDLTSDLKQSDFVVTMNSNTGVDAILAGIPVHAGDVGSMVYSIASHDLRQKWVSRWQRLSEISWCQWKVEEMRSGLAWDVTKTAVKL